jgi:methionine-S-sulfoxide reductase
VSKLHSIVLGGGCFWCLEAFYQQLRGILEVTPGYAGGTTTNPTYEQVCSGIGNHAEVVKVDFDPNIITLTTILEFFWAVHDPTTLNRQGFDAGPQYRSAIYYSNDSDRTTSESVLGSAQDLWQNPIVTEIRKLDTFYPAESYHKNYFINHPEKAYCQVIINPRLAEIHKKYANLLA